MPRKRTEKLNHENIEKISIRHLYIRNIEFFVLFFFHVDACYYSLSGNFPNSIILIWHKF